MSIYSEYRNHIPAPPQAVSPLYPPPTKSSESLLPQLVHFPSPEQSQASTFEARRAGRRSDVYRKLLGRPHLQSRSSNCSTSLNGRILQLKYSRPSENCPFGGPKSRLANALQAPSSRVEAVEHWRTRVHMDLAERPAVGTSMLTSQGNAHESTHISTLPKASSTSTLPSTSNTHHHSVSLAVPRREPPRPRLLEHARTEPRTTELITLEQSFSNLLLYSHSTNQSVLPSPPMSPLQVQTRTRPSDEKKVRRRSNHRLSQQQAARAHGNRRPSLRRTSRQSILGRKTMGVSEDPFPSGTDRSPVDSSLGAITSAWEEHCRRADDTVASNQEQRNNIDRPCAPADIQVSHEPSVFSVLAAYNAPLRINVTVETMTISTTSGWVKSTATTNAVANAHHVERQLPRLSVPEFSPFNVQSLDPFHESISGLLFTQPAPTTTISSSNFSTPLITPEASPRSTMGHGHEVVVHENNVSADGIRTSEIGDEGETGESTGVKERKKPKLTLDMGVVGEYPTVSRRKGEIVLIRESIGSSRRKAAAKAPEPDQLTNNGS